MKVVAVIVLITAGCSLTMQTPAKRLPLSVAPECSGAARPLLDIAGGIAIASVGYTITSIKLSSDSEDEEAKGAGALVVGGAIGAAMLVTAVTVGFPRSSRCNAAKRRHQRWRRAQQPRPSSTRH